MTKILTAAVAIIALSASVTSALAERDHPSADVTAAQNSNVAQPAAVVVPAPATVQLSPAEGYIVNRNR